MAGRAGGGSSPRSPGCAKRSSSQPPMERRVAADHQQRTEATSRGASGSRHEPRLPTPSGEARAAAMARPKPFDPTARPSRRRAPPRARFPSPSGGRERRRRRRVRVEANDVLAAARRARGSARRGPRPGFRTDDRDGVPLRARSTSSGVPSVEPSSTTRRSSRPPEPPPDDRARQASMARASFAWGRPRRPTGTRRAPPRRRAGCPRSRAHTTLRVGVYADLVYRRDGSTLSTHRAFILFVCGLEERVDELVLFGRLAPGAERAPYALPAGVRHVAFPHYARVTDLLGVVRSLRGSIRAFDRELSQLDVVWIFGPYPVPSSSRSRPAPWGPVVLGVRQDIPSMSATGCRAAAGVGDPPRPRARGRLPAARPAGADRRRRRRYGEPLRSARRRSSRRR